ncbi:hypothetical protein Tco_0452614 [Tanacetum coccineum]
MLRHQPPPPVITDRITRALPSDTVKNPKLNDNSTSLVFSARSYPTEDPQCSTRIHSSINAITICPKQPSESQNNKPKEEEREGKDNPGNINTNPSSPPDPSVSFITEKVRKLNSFFESFGLVPQSSDTEFVSKKWDDGNFTYVLDFMIVEDISSIMDPRLSHHPNVTIPLRCPDFWGCYIDQLAGGKLRDKNANESWALLEDLALYDCESCDDPRDFAKPVKAISLPQDVPSASDRHLIELKNQVCTLNSFLKSSGLVPQSSDTEFVCTKWDDEDIMFIEIIRKYDDSRKEELREDENATTGGLEVEYFDTFPTRSELAYHKKVDPMEDPNRGVSNFTGRIKGMHVFVGNFTYVIDFMIVEDISLIVDPRKAHLLENKQIPSVGVFTLRWILEGIHVTWAQLEKKRIRPQLYTNYLEENLTDRRDGVSNHKRRCQDHSRDGVRDFQIALERSRLKETLKDSTGRQR